MPSLRYGKIKVHLTGFFIDAFLNAISVIPNAPNGSKTTQIGRMRLIDGRPICMECIKNPRFFSNEKYFCDECFRQQEITSGVQGRTNPPQGAMCPMCGNSGQILSSDDVLSCPLCTSSEGNDSTLFVNNEASTDSIRSGYVCVICSSENKLGVSCPHCKQLVSCTGCYQQLHQTCPNCREEWRIF